MSDRECSSLSDSNSSYNESNHSSSSEGDEHVLASEFLPYQNEPFADTSSESDDNGEQDEYRLFPAILRQRYENEVRVDKWLVFQVTVKLYGC